MTVAVAGVPSFGQVNLIPAVGRINSILLLNPPGTVILLKGPVKVNGSSAMLGSGLRAKIPATKRACFDFITLPKMSSAPCCRSA